MWWLLRADIAAPKRRSLPSSSLNNRATSNTDQVSSNYNYFHLSAYPDPPATWMKVDANNHANQETIATNSSTTAGSSTECYNNCHSHDSTLRGRRRNVGNSNHRFCLREVKKPDKKSLRLVPLLKHSNILGKKKKAEILASCKNTPDQGGQTAGGDDQNDGSAAPFLLPNGANTDCSFPVPSSWRCTTSNGLIQAVDHEQKKKSGSIITIKLPLKDSNGSNDQGLSLSQKLSILYDQEGFTPPIPRYAIPKSLHTERQPSEAEKRLCNWIALEVKPLIGRLEGSRRSTSSIGKKLNKKSRRLCLWHEEFSRSGGRSAQAILLHSLVSSSRHDALTEKKLLSPGGKLAYSCKPICQLMRVTLPCNFRASPRIAPEEQQNELEKGGHGSTRDKLADYSMLVESLRRQKDARLDKEEARMLLCKGVLHDNAQEYRKAIESYREYLILSIKNGDKLGEATACNFIGCSLQEEQDLKLVEYYAKSNHDRMEVPSAAAIEYEKSEEYHKLHAEAAGLDGKFMAHTNLGLLYANLGRWGDATAAHQTALRCATLTERPDCQGVAVGNLGFALFRQKEWVTAKACMIKYLQICVALKDTHGLARAHYILGSIASQRKRHEEAVVEFEAALKASRLVKDHKMETLSKIMVGVAQGDSMLEKHEEAT